MKVKAVEKVEDVKTGLIKSRRIIFTPSVDLKDGSTLYLARCDTSNQ